MLSKIKLINTNKNWEAKRRYKINAVVNYYGNIFQNTTGSNSAPTLLIDWIFVKSNTVYLSEQLEFEANGTDNFIDIGTSQKARSFFYGSVIQDKSVWSQTGTIINFTFTPDAGAGIKNLQFI